ncbi:MAG: hypothetical protein K2L45_09540 [Muribaculaceae bacterium]|nr:hypothetical protein [Muribaculaceae bacterium]
MTRYKKRIVTYLLMMVLFVPLWGKDYLHIFTSKGIYETSEDLWFKCIAFDDSTMLISDRSHTAFVEIVDPSDSVVWREKYRMSNGMCDGQVYVGDDWKPGEYRMFVHTRNSLGKGDTVLYPKRLLIVPDLSVVPDFLSSARERVQYIDVPDTTEQDKLNVTVTLDSTEYHPRSKVKATVRVTDAVGNPVRAVLALSVADALYSYPLADVDIESQTHSILHDSVMTENKGFEPFLSDGPVSGSLRSGRKKNTVSLDGQYINVFDESAEKGAVNVISTGNEGYFEVSPEIGSSLGRVLLLKPLVDEDLKPKLELDNPYRDMAELRMEAVEKTYPVIREKNIHQTEDTIDYSGRHTISLDEIVVNGKGNVFAKRNKVMGYLDSLALTLERAWVCCGGWVKGEYVGGWLNDYREGYTHHPTGGKNDIVYPPRNVTTPVRGKMYEMVKYRWSEKLGCYIVADQQRVHYLGPNYSDEELLSMEGLWKTEGYYPKHRFRIPSEDEQILGIEDFRNTLLWLPRAQTDENGEFTFEFPTSDIKSTFRISGLILTPNIKDARTINEYFKVK